MSVLDKLFFWKRDEEFNFDELAGKDMAHPAADPFGTEEKSPFTENSAPPFGAPPKFPEPSSPASFHDEESHPLQRGTSAPSASRNTDLELVNSKLDTIKAVLNSIEQRLNSLERSLGTKKEKLW